MSRTFDTREASAAERLDYWTQTVCDQIVPVQIDPRGAEQLAGTAMRSTGIAVPLAHRLAARIQERDWEDFTCDPTQLRNGLRDLADDEAHGLPVVERRSLAERSPAVGVVLTSEHLGRETDVSELEDRVAAVHG